MQKKQYAQAIGNVDEALAQLERGFDIRAIAMMFLTNGPLPDLIRQEPRYKALVKKIHLD